MLQIPLKKMVELDLVSPLKRYLETEFDEAEAARHTDDLRALQLLRNGAMAIKQASGGGEAGQRSLQEYDAQLAMCGPRLPVGETQLTMNFTWNDAFVGNKKSAAQSSVAFERAAVLFNCGAYESQLGASAERKSDEGLKLSCKRFQQAAGYFEHVKGSVFPPETHASASGTPVTPDLSEQGLTMATQLMLAQRL